MEKVGKMVLKIKPWKSGTNKLSSSRQFRAACKKLERLNLTFLRTKFIFRKGQGIYWKKFFARKGPLPLPNRFLRPTRVHLDDWKSNHRIKKNKSCTKQTGVGKNSKWIIWCEATVLSEIYTKQMLTNDFEKFWNWISHQLRKLRTDVKTS